MKKDKRLILLSIIILMCLWEIASKVVENNLIFPSIESIFYRIFDILKNKEFIISILSSIYRCLIASAIAIGLALVLGILSFKSKFIYNFCYPIFNLIRALPTMAFIVLALIWFSKDYAPILIGVLIALPILYDVILNSILNIDNNIIDMCNIYRVDRKKVFIEIYLAQISISLINILSSTISLIFKVIIAGELYSQPKYGIGAAIQFEKMQLNTDSIVAWILIVTFVSYNFDKILSLIKLKFNKFQEVT